MILSKEDILRTASFRTSRSGGKGGQNVNKVSSKVELVFNIAGAELFTPEELSLLTTRLAHRLDQEGNLHVVSQEDRSQLVNKERTIMKLISILQTALHVQKIRKPTKTPKSVIRKRLADKQSTSAKKELRRRPAID